MGQVKTAESAAPVQQVKRGRGRPRKDGGEHGAPEKAPSRFKFSVGNTLLSFGIEGDTITKKHDNSQSVHLLEIDGKVVLVYEFEDKATYFRPAFSSSRTMKATMKAIEHLGVSSDDEDEEELEILEEPAPKKKR